MRSVGSRAICSSPRLLMRGRNWRKAYSPLFGARDVTSLLRRDPGSLPRAHPNGPRHRPAHRRDDPRGSETVEDHDPRGVRERRRRHLGDRRLQRLPRPSDRHRPPWSSELATVKTDIQLICDVLTGHVVKDFDQAIESAEAWLLIAGIQLLGLRIARAWNPKGYFEPDSHKAQLRSWCRRTVRLVASRVSVPRRARRNPAA